MLKQVLLDTGYFVDNSYLDEYLELVQKPFSFSGYSEKHHVIPAMVYNIKYSIRDRTKARKLADKDPNNFLVDLLFKDHCKVYWLLYSCTIGEVKACNARAYIFMTGKNLDSIVELSNEEYNEVQAHRDLIMNEDDYYWSQAEIQVLYDHYLDYSFEELTSVLHKPKYCIIAKANRLGLFRPRDRFWSNEDTQWLISNYSKYTRKECADILNKTEASINKKCTTLGLYKPSTAWTEAQNNWLIENYTRHTVSESAAILGRTYNAVRSQAVKLGLKNPITETRIKEKKTVGQKRFRWTPETEQWLIQNFSSLGQYGCAKHFGITESAVYNKYMRIKNK